MVAGKTVYQEEKRNSIPDDTGASRTPSKNRIP
jgi:hypothetical protein